MGTPAMEQTNHDRISTTHISRRTTASHNITLDHLQHFIAAVARNGFQCASQFGLLKRAEVLFLRRYFYTSENMQMDCVGNKAKSLGLSLARHANLGRGTRLHLGSGTGKSCHEILLPVPAM